METSDPHFFFFFLLSLSTILLSLINSTSASFTPVDNYLINCGSNTNTSTDTRLFLADSTKPGSNFLSPPPQKSISLLKNQNPPDLGSDSSSLLYLTARVFTSVSSFTFPIHGVGALYIVRLHFSPFCSSYFNLSSAHFDVSINGFKLLKNFSCGALVLKEYIVKMDKNFVKMEFSPATAGGSRPSFAFVNAVEVFSAPGNLFTGDGATLVGPADGVTPEKYRKVLETIHRVNVGGPKITPYNDTLWRTWVPDENFLVLKSAAKSVTLTHFPHYWKGGPTREIAPDYVYMTAQQMNKGSLMNSWFNISWDFPMGSSNNYNCHHLIRLHFCDIVSRSLDLLVFNVFINGYLAYEDLDLTLLTGTHIIASPYYMDFVVGSSCRLGVLRVSIGPSNLTLSKPYLRNAILNGVEIMNIMELENSKSIVASEQKNWVMVALSTILLMMHMHMHIDLRFVC
ncbi:probable receptor-like protein kinase At5g24010 [Malania oleifera]|uniref:probable receptor-like protein kinase At5g24010 n=1 Tax=Malania oleifera TaxID=397392 RepID=UPI0025AE9E00|nr:probable receptor-like protein kinase At5g24010 [Malania oleifera]